MRLGGLYLGILFLRISSVAVRGLLAFRGFGKKSILAVEGGCSKFLAGFICFALKDIHVGVLKAFFSIF